MSRKLMDELQAADYGSPLKQFQRDTLLDLVLAWGSLDGALTILVSTFTGEALHEAADRMGKLKGSMKILEIVALLEGIRLTSEVANEMVKKFKKLKKRYEKHSKPRDRIAHAHCCGYLLSDDQYIVFAITEREGQDHMAVEAIPIQEIVDATNFGRTLTTFAIQTAESFGSLGKSPPSLA